MSRAFYRTREEERLLEGARDAISNYEWNKKELAHFLNTHPDVREKNDFRYMTSLEYDEYEALKNEIAYVDLLKSTAKKMFTPIKAESLINYYDISGGKHIDKYYSPGYLKQICKKMMLAVIRAIEDGSYKDLDERKEGQTNQC